MGGGIGRLPYLRRGRLPAGRTKRHLPALRFGDLHSLDWRSGGLQSDWGGFAHGWWRPGDRYFVVDASREGDSAVGARTIVPLLLTPSHLPANRCRPFWAPSAAQALDRGGAGALHGVS